MVTLLLHQNLKLYVDYVHTANKNIYIPVWIKHIDNGNIIVKQT